MSYGTPGSKDDILAFYTDVRRGRPPSKEQLDELTRRYELIGSKSPLTENTLRQVDTIASYLSRHYPNRYRVKYATKHANPKIEETVKEFAEENISSLTGLVFAPHYSKFSVGQYIERAEKAAADYDIKCNFIKSFALNPALLDFLENQVIKEVFLHANTYGSQQPENTPARRKIMILITAHSLPAQLVAMGDLYPDELKSTAAAIADHLGLPSESRFVALNELKTNLLRWQTTPEVSRIDDRQLEPEIEIAWQCAWQSAGKTDQEWLGPDILTVIEELAGQQITDIIICPAGFMSDHLEILYDIDIDAQNLANKLGVSLSRTQSVNNDPTVIGSLAESIHHLADRHF